MSSRILDNNDGSFTMFIYFDSSDKIEDLFRVIKKIKLGIIFMLGMIMIIMNWFCFCFLNVDNYALR